MIYIIIDSSHEYDDWNIPEEIIYVGKDKEDAIAYFNRFCKVKFNPEEKWHYVYYLYEYGDEWGKFYTYNPPTLLTSSDSYEKEKSINQ